MSTKVSPMASPEISPKRRRLNLSLKDKQNGKENKDETKASTTDSVDAKKNNFMKACAKVSHEAYQDFKKRFQLLYIPECINNMCNHGDRNANMKKMSRSAELSFKTEFKNGAWYDALEICVVCTTPCNYLSANVLKDVVEIMMNAHEDIYTGYTIDYLLKKCQHVLMMHFNMHPPCVAKNIREFYGDFLMSKMDAKVLSNRKVYLSDEGIVSHCFSRLIHETSLESKDGTIIEEEEIPLEIEGVKRLHWKKDNLELYELLVRTERIERCMLVLESIIYLLQIDLALWDARCSSSHSTVRSQRPLLASILWPYSCITNRTVTTQCHKIMKLFAYFIHLQYPERHIKTMCLWMNAAMQMFYVYRHPGNDYPAKSSYVTAFANEFYNIIAPFPSSSISKILEKIQPTFMRYLIGIHHTQHLFHTTEDDILTIIIWSFNSMSWDNYCVEEHNPIVHFKNTRLKPGKLMSYLSKKCKSLDVPIHIAEKRYPKFNLEPNTSETSQNHIIDTLFITFVAYLEAYSIKKFNQVLDWYNENDNNCDQTFCKSVSDRFVKQYRSIIQSLQQLLVILNKEQCVESLKKLSDLINIYFS